MKRTYLQYLIVLALILSSCLFCQAKELFTEHVGQVPQEIKTALDNLKSRKKKLSFLLSEAEHLKTSDPKLALVLTEEAGNLARDKTGLYFEYAQSLYWSTWINLRQRPYSEQYKLLLANLDICQQIFENEKADLWLTRTYDLIASTYGYQVNSLERHEEGYTKMLRNLARAYNDKAFRQIEVVTQKDSVYQILLAELLHTRAAIHLSLEQADSARILLENSLQLFEDINHQAGIAKASLNLADISGPEKAIQLFEKAIRLYQQHGSTNDLAFAYFQLGRYCLNPEIIRINTNWEKWVPVCTEALHQAIKLDSDIECKLFSRLGLIHFYNRINQPEDLLKALTFFKKALHKAEEESDADCLRTLISRIQEVCERTDSCQGVMIEVNKVYASLLVRTDSIVTAAQLKTKEFELYRLANTTNAKWYRISGGLVVLFTVGFLFFYLLRRNQMQKQQMEFDKEKIRNLELERKMWKAKEEARAAQLKPHVIANILAAIEGLINTDRKEEASRFIQLFSQYNNQVLINSEKTLIPLSEEIDLLEDYIELNKLRMGDNLQFHRISIAEDIDPKKINIPPMLAQPDIENAIWHGIKKKQAPGHLSVSIKRRGENQIQIAIEDDGIGIAKSEALKKDSRRKRPSMGTKIVEDRLEAINQKIMQLALPLEQSSTFASRMVESLFDQNKKPLGTRIVITLPDFLKPELL